MGEALKVLVTGGAGFIGSNIAKHLKSVGYSKVYVLDDFSSGHFKNLIGFKGQVITGDVRDKSLWDWLIKEFKFDVIFHQAAITDTTLMDQRLMMEVNAESFRNVLKAASAWGSKVIYASSAGVYGNTPPPMREDGLFKPENIYGYSKLSMDIMAMDFMKEREDMYIVGLRYFNVYGTGESYKGRSASMIYQLYSRMVSGQKPRLFKWGEQRRDFVYIEDVVKANMLAMEKNVRGIFNVGTGQGRSFNEVVEILGENLGTKPDTEYFDCPYDFYQKHTEADLKRAREMLGYKPEFSLEDGIKDYVRRLMSP